MNAASSWGGAAGGADLYGAGFDKPLPRRVYTLPQRKVGFHSVLLPLRYTIEHIRIEMEEWDDKCARLWLHFSRSNVVGIILQTSGINKNHTKHSKEQRKPVKVRDLMDQPKIPQNQSTKSANLEPQKSSISVKPVDEDLYKIPPELLGNSKRVSLLMSFDELMAV